MKTKPVPVRFEKAEDAFLKKASFDTGMPVSELIRRSVRLMRQQRQVFKSYGFVVELS